MTYSPDFRQKVLQKLAEGLSVRKVAQLFGINFMTVQKWKTNPVPKSQQIHPPKKIRAYRTKSAKTLSWLMFKPIQLIFFTKEQNALIVPAQQFIKHSCVITLSEKNSTKSS